MRGFAKQRAAMPRDEILAILIDCARKAFGEPELAFEESTRFDEIEAWDSANHLRMVVSMERAFGIRFANADLMRLDVVGDLSAVIERRYAEAHGGA